MFSGWLLLSEFWRLRKREDGGENPKHPCLWNWLWQVEICSPFNHSKKRTPKWNCEINCKTSEVETKEFVRTQTTVVNVKQFLISINFSFMPYSIIIIPKISIRNMITVWNWNVWNPNLKPAQNELWVSGVPYP